ncbi:MAG TPA: hypothetical protein VGT44_11445, partial [Ktedonobacteraceae bacterium]|nr:hypothetical protein [Ktedonobacteraceae bacterium]
MSLRQLQEAREKRFDRLSSMPSPVLNEPSLEEQVYPCTIDDIHYSENAILLFCHNSVIKKLLPYKDKRYDLEDILNRHACLLEGLKWNR